MVTAKNSVLTTEQWKAIRENDENFDDQFFYAVRTTKIFCRPSCKSRVPNFNNVTIFYNVDEALAAGFRPCKRCKRCKSAGFRLPDEEWVLQAEAYMREHSSKQLTLDRKNEQDRHHENSEKVMKMRCYVMKYNEENVVYYGHIKSDGCSIYLAVTDTGLCFIGSDNGRVSEMKSWFNSKRPRAHLVEDWNEVSVYAEQLVDYLNGERKNIDLPIDLNGTEFQEAVWAELQNIPYGKTKSYTDISEAIGKPDSVRAVGTAVGANPLLIVVPCHRVISKSGKLTGYRGGIPMKEKLLRLERS
ncbi:methylated-DNA--[protein]-cysteine S-methyltransferase [Virgibacillus salinus]|uniref:Methylated-DNA--protein-cysteine methyltransferase n=1 Tax=Virgibacillus salinus TaxID=553311 RepID=A0A1H1FJM1_9BACI|nr:O-6-methylguanine DNA methyltransferase [Virgibacillus salinus]